MEQLAGALRAAGVDVTFLARHIDEKSSTVDRVVKIGHGDREPRMGYLMDAPALYRALQAVRPSLIYQRVGGGYTGIAAYYAQRHAARMIWHVAHDSDVTRTALEPARNPIRPWLEKTALEYGLRRAHAIVTQTHHQATLLQQNFGRRADMTVPNFHPEPREILDKSGRLTIIWIANLRPWKRPDAFVRLAASMADMRQAQFVMIGAPAQGSGDRRWSEALMQSLSATPNLTYLGPKSRAEVHALLAMAHVFVNTSESEGFPNTFIEAWMRAVPVVSLSVNPDEVFDRHRVGIHAKTEEQLQRSVRAFIADEALRTQYANTARDYALEHHSLKNAGVLARFIMNGGRPCA